MRGYAELCRKTESRLITGSRLLIRGSRVRVPDGSPIISGGCLDLLRLDSVRDGLVRFRCAETRRKNVVERRCGFAEVLRREVSVAKRDREGLVA